MSHSTTLRLCARPILLFAAACPAAPFAQTEAPRSSQTIVVTGNPLGRESVAQPVSVLAGDGLMLRRAGTLGDTLDGLAGVATSWFGPNAGRPVVRGLDGDRVRVLDNGGASIDASSLSFDHAVAIDPLAVERIEVLRGPAALLYGGSATGGVVNTVDNRIPKSALSGISGRAESRFGGAVSQRAVAALVEGGSGTLAWHLDAFGRRTSDLRVPRFTPQSDGQALAPSQRVRNSASDAQGGALGASWIGSDGRVGLSADTYRNDYGVTVEPDVLIRMKRDRIATSGEWRLTGWLNHLALDASRTRYAHDEVEGSGAIGTRFRSLGSDLRLQARHAALAGFSGVFGVQGESMRFSALGAEAFVPGTRTRSTALFVVEERTLGSATLSLGARAERVRVMSEGDAVGAPEPRFGAPQQRRFAPLSMSASVLWPLAPGWSVNASASRTERAPTFYELYANGLHLATAAFEVGDATLGVERSRHLELGASLVLGPMRLKGQFFDTRFARFISLDATGRDIPVPDEETGATRPAPEFVFRAVQAQLRGFEIEGRWRLVQLPWTLDLSAGFDAVRADNLDRGEPLPRITPQRTTLTLETQRGGWRVGAGLRHAAAQNRVPANDTATPAHTLLNLWLAWTTVVAAGEITAFGRIDNVTDRLAYNAGSIGTIRGLAPLPGRSVSAGVRVGF